MTSSRLASAVLSVVCVGALLLSGCGSSGSSPAASALPPAGQTAQDHLQTLTGGASVPFDLAREAEYFAGYHSQYPTDPAGDLGYSVTRVAGAADALARQYGLSDGLLANLGNLRAAISGVADGSAAAGWQQILALVSGQGLRSFSRQARLTGAGRAETAAPSPAQVAADLRSVLIPALRDAIGALGPAVAAPSPIFTFSQEGQSVTVRAVDALAYRAALEGALAAAASACAYSWDSGDFVWGRSPADLDADHDGLLTPAEYLPGGDFLTLTDGAAVLEGWASLSASLVDAAEVARLMSAGQPDSLLAVSAAGADWSAMGTGLAAAQLALKGSATLPLTFTMPGSQMTTTLNLTVNPSAFWTNPPRDLRALLPTFRLLTSADGQAQVQIASLPDKSFGGLLPRADTEIPALVWAYLFTLPLG